MSSLWITQWALNPVTSVLIRHAQRGHVAMEQIGAHESWKGQAGASLQPPRSTALQYPDFSFWLQNYERTNFCCFKPQSLWQFVWLP